MPSSLPDPPLMSNEAPQPAAGLGRPPKRSPIWLQRYDRVAQRLFDEIRPETVLDAGCSIGLLVEGLRRRGVQAEGIDPDPDAVMQAGASIRPFLSVASLAEDLPRRYDLIVCIAALDEAARDTAEAAIANLCRHTDAVIFSSGRSDGPVSPAEYAEIFARQDFLRDMAFDASFISPWAERFRRSPLAAAEQTMKTHEPSFLELREENLRLGKENAVLRREYDRLWTEYTVARKTLEARLIQWESTWADLEHSTAWKFIEGVRRLRLRLAPAGSRRAALIRLAIASLSVLRKQGPGAFFRHWSEGLPAALARRSTGEKSIQQRNEEAYPSFVERMALPPDQLDRQRVTSRGWAHRPLVSIITPVYRPPVDVLRATIESALAQTYEHWELCIADASPDAPEVRGLLEEYAARDARIRVEFLEHNLGICGNSNAAIRAAHGEFLAILDHDDVLAPQMLFEVVRCIQENATADLIYFDEDKLSEDGSQRRAPFFKPDFSPEMLISANYLTHAVYGRSLVEAVGGFDPDYEGCQDWDLAFKAIERTREVVHIPQVLYHWRQVSGSTAGDFGAKAYVFERQLKCVQQHLERTGLSNVQTSFPVPGVLRAVWPASGARVSIIIPTKDKAEYLERSVESLRARTDYPAYEILIVDNGSTQPKTHRYFDRLRQQGGVRIIDFAEKFNYSRANNLGARHANGDIFLFLNNDVEILHADWLEEMVRWTERPGVGVVGAKLLYPDKTIQHAGVVVGMEGHASHVFYGYRERQSGPFGSVDWYRNFSAVTGACMMVSRAIFEQIGGFSEKYILAFSDIEFCLRTVEQGYRVVYTPHARLHHFEGKSRGDHIPTHDILAGVDDFLPMMKAGDPFYNPNLSCVSRQPLVLADEEESRETRLLRLAAIARYRQRIAESDGKTSD